MEQVKARRARDQERMDRGLVASPKDLDRMSQELVSLSRRISDLEDEELEVMERLESAQNRHASLGGRLAALDERIAQLSESRDAVAGDLTSQLAAATDERKVTVSGVPAGLVTLYEKIRAQKGGVGAARLIRRRCTGCSLDLTAADLGAFARAPLDEVLRCEECDRILVRTAESGI